MTIDVDNLPQPVLAAMLRHAQQEAPREACGLLVRVAEPGMAQLAYCAGVNLYAGRAGQDRFSLDPQAWVQAEEMGEVVAVVHSHPNASANPSMADRVGCERTGLPWLIVGWPSGVVKQLEPSGWSAPYEGRQWADGVLDCYTLLQDWYRRELQIELPDMERTAYWWDGEEDLYMANYAKHGFHRVQGPLQRHDVVLMQVKSDKANHGAIYLGDGNILHHPMYRPSSCDVYGGYWLQHTLAVVRHESQVQR